MNIVSNWEKNSIMKNKIKIKIKLHDVIQQKLKLPVTLCFTYFKCLLC